jgi:DNA-directed RNA polymerase subunit K/omega
MEFVKENDNMDNEAKGVESDNESEYSYENEEEEQNKNDDDDDEDEDNVDDDDDEDDEDEDDDEDLELLEKGTGLEEMYGNRETPISDDDEHDNDEDDSDNDDEDDEDYLQKFSKHINTNDLEKLHPGINMCNNEEVSALSRIVRDQKGRIIDPLHTTLPFITKYEKARIVGARAEQLDRGAIPMVKVDPEVINGRIIAEMELQQKKIPFILARPLPNGKVEYWRIEDLEFV